MNAEYWNEKMKVFEDNQNTAHQFGRDIRAAENKNLVQERTRLIAEWKAFLDQEPAFKKHLIDAYYEGYTYWQPEPQPGD